MKNTINQPQILAIHDLSGFGHTSLMAVIPLVYAHGLNLCVLPSSLLSSNTCYNDFRLLDTGNFMKQCLEHYKELRLTFQAIYSGFLGGPEQVSTLLHAGKNFLAEDGIILVDPVMADEGKLYSCYDFSMVLAMRRLVSIADIITPNFTEACFLADLPVLDDVDANFARDLCDILHTLGAKEVIVTSAPRKNDDNLIIYSEKKGSDPVLIPNPHLPTFFTGTGDMFSTLTLIYAMNNVPRIEGIKKAADFIFEAIKYSNEKGRDGRSGVILQDFIRKFNV
ncbi:MAG: pyridoxamine kinase [Candidatus Cloacimonetes bacterium]|nr:pyridoxamine kinase [Candidatus Cloacimonadota bacterium]